MTTAAAPCQRDDGEKEIANYERDDDKWQIPVQPQLMALASGPHSISHTL